MNVIEHGGKRYKVRVVSRPKKGRWWDTPLTLGILLYFVVVGGLSGLIIAALLVHKYVAPGHPLYVGIKRFLEGVFL